MRVNTLPIKGAAVVSIDRLADSRGFFARTFCQEEFAGFDLPANFVQASVSFNYRKGTLRGLHFQWPNSREAKLVRCTRGRVHDVLLDLRPASPTYMLHRAVILDAEERNAVVVPAGVAHGFQTLADDTEVFYQMTDVYAPDLAAGVRWNDTAFSIEWPIADAILSDRDRDYPDFVREQFEVELHNRKTAGPQSPQKPGAQTDP